MGATASNNSGSLENDNDSPKRNETVDANSRNEYNEQPFVKSFKLQIHGYNLPPSNGTGLETHYYRMDSDYETTVNIHSVTVPSVHTNTSRASVLHPSCSLSIGHGVNQAGSAIGGGISASTTAASPGMNNSLNSALQHHPSNSTSSLTAGPASINHTITPPSSSSPFDPTNYFTNDLFNNDAAPIVEVIRLPPATGRFMRSFRLRIVPVSHPTNTFNTNNTSLTQPLSDSTSAVHPPNSLLYVCKTCVLRYRDDAQSRTNFQRALQLQIYELQQLRSRLSPNGNVETDTDRDMDTGNPNASPYTRWIVGEPVVDATSSVEMPTHHHSSTNSLHSQNERSSVGPSSPTASSLSLTSVVNAKWVYQAVYLLRPYYFTTLSQRLSTGRPNLTDMERHFITYQMVRGCRGLHNLGISHGNLSPHNICLTSWNWVVITDFGVENVNAKADVGGGGNAYTHGAKEDDVLGDFWYYYQKQFDVPRDDGGEGYGSSATRQQTQTKTGSHQVCYLAPERILSKSYSSNSTPTNTDKTAGVGILTPAMDMFSVGCILMELYLGGETVFELGDLIRYGSYSARGTSDDHTLHNERNEANDAALPLPSSTAIPIPTWLTQKLNKIESLTVRAACRNLISRFPHDRCTAENILKRLSVDGSMPPTNHPPTAQTSEPDRANKNQQSGSCTPSNTERIPDTLPSVCQTPTPTLANSVMPACFANFVFPLLSRLQNEVYNPDARIALAAIHYENAIRCIVYDGLPTRDYGSSSNRVTPGSLRACDEHGNNGSIDAGTDIDCHYFRGIVGRAMLEYEGLLTRLSVRDGTHATTNDSSPAVPVRTSDGTPTSSPNSDPLGPLPSSEQANHDAPEKDWLLDETEELLRQLSIFLPSTEDDIPALSTFATLPKSTHSTTAQIIDNEQPDSTTTTAETHTATPNSDTVHQPQKGSSSVSSSPSSSAIRIYIQIITSSLRHATRTSTKLLAFHLLYKLSNYASDDDRLELLIPTVSRFIDVSYTRTEHPLHTNTHDGSGLVCATALHVTIAILHQISHIPPRDSNLMTDYMFPLFHTLLQRTTNHIHLEGLDDSHTFVVRLALGNNIAPLAEIARRFLEKKHAARLYERVVNDVADIQHAEAEAVAQAERHRQEEDSKAKDKRFVVPMFPEDEHLLLVDKETKGIQANEPHEYAATTTNVVASTESSAREEPTAKTVDDIDIRDTPGGPEVDDDASVVSHTTSSADGVPLRAYEPQYTTLVPTDTFDTELTHLHEQISNWIIQLTTSSAQQSTSNDPNAYTPRISSTSHTKHAVLTSLPSLTAFFGPVSTTSQLLPQLLTFLNDRDDWELRCRLLANLPTVCGVVGRVATEQFVVPCVEMSLLEEECLVVWEGLRCLSRLVEMGLVTSRVLLNTNTSPLHVGCDPVTNDDRFEGLLQKYSSLVLHPSEFVRFGILSLISVVCRSVGYPDDVTFVIPLLRPFLRYEPTSGQLQSSLGVNVDVNSISPKVNRSNTKVEALSEVFLPPVSWQGYNAELQRLALERHLSSTSPNKTDLPPHTDDIATNPMVSERSLGSWTSVRPKVSGTVNTDGTTITATTVTDLFDDLLSDEPSGGAAAAETTNGVPLDTNTFCFPDVVSQVDTNDSVMNTNNPPAATHTATSNDPDDSSSTSSDEDTEAARLSSMRDYLSMAVRFKRQNSTQVSSHNHGVAAATACLLPRTRTLQSEVSPSVPISLAHSFVVPNQKYAELLSIPVPDWFHELRELSRVTSVNVDVDGHDNTHDNTRSLETNALRSVSSLGLAYGLADTGSSGAAHTNGNGGQLPLLPFMKKWKTNVLDGNPFEEILQDEPQGNTSTTRISQTLTQAAVMQQFLDTRHNLDAKTLSASTMYNSNSIAPEEDDVDCDCEWGAIGSLDPSLVQTSRLISKLRCLDIPPLPPKLGVLREADGRPFSWHGPILTSNTNSAVLSGGTAVSAPLDDASNPQTNSDTLSKSIPNAQGTVNRRSSTHEWKPRSNSLILSSSSTNEHTAAVTRLAVSQDRCFFVSASHDGTCKVWELRQLEEAVDLQSSLTYSGHMTDGNNGRIGSPGTSGSAGRKGNGRFLNRSAVDGTAAKQGINGNGNGNVNNGGVRINDVSIIENSHSVVTAASNGSVHVWRVDMVSSKGNNSTLLGNTDKARINYSDPSTSTQADTTMASSPQYSIAPTNSTRYYDTCRVSRSTTVRSINPVAEGETLAVSHFNTASASVVVYATQAGYIHTWDLRCAHEPFQLQDLHQHPELGYVTSMSVGADRNWIVAGTHRGCVALWDIRYPLLAKLWRHSAGAPVDRLATTVTTLPQDIGINGGSSSTPSPLIFMGCGLNESSVFDVTNGNCRQCFRALDPALGYTDQQALPQSCLTLPHLQTVELPNNPNRSIASKNEGYATYTTHGLGRGLGLPGVIPNTPHNPEPRIMSLMGRIGVSGNQYLITGGSDCVIRYWDFTSPQKCYTVSGLLPGQPSPRFESVPSTHILPSPYASYTSQTQTQKPSHHFYQFNNSLSQLFLCRQYVVPSMNNKQMYSAAYVDGQSPSVLPPPNNAHADAILDLKNVDFPVKGLLSCSRDGIIKLWR